MNRTGIENRVPGCEGTICLSWEYKKSICVIFKTCKYSSLVRYFFLNVPYSRQKCLLAISCYTNNLHYIPYWYVWQLWQPMGNSPVIITADLPIQMKTELLCMDEFITGNVLLVSPMDIFPTCWLFKIGILKKKGKKNMQSVFGNCTKNWCHCWFVVSISKETYSLLLHDFTGCIFIAESYTVIAHI